MAVAVMPVIGTVVQMADGGWAIDDGGATADGFITAAASGGVQVDDAAVSGLNVRVVGTTPVVY